MKIVQPSGYVVLILACLVAFGPLSIDMYLPALPTIATDLASDTTAIKQTITIFLIGFSVGMLIYGPLSDYYGRRKLLLAGVVVYLCATIASVLAPSADFLLIARLFQALGGASASVLARAMVRDIYEVKDAAKILSWMQIITMIATLIAPILGGILVTYYGWRSIFIFLFVFVLTSATMFATRLPETLPEERRLPSVMMVFKSYYQIATSSIGLAYILCMASAFAGMFVYITTSPFIFIEYFGLSSQQYAYVFGFNIFGIMIMTTINATFVGRVGPQKMIQIGTTTLFLSSLALLLMGATGIGGLWGIIFGIWFFVAMTGSLNANCIALLMRVFPMQAGAAAGLAISFQFGLGALMSFIVSQFGTNEPWPMTHFMALMGCVSLLSMFVSRASYSKYIAS